MYSAIVAEPIDVAGLAQQVASEEDGALVLFLGNVRNRNDGRPVSGMEYEAYTEMAEQVLRDIVGEVTGLLRTTRIAVVHRIGVLGVGETSVAIAAASPHREEAYRASRYVIEEIKTRLPIWKREHYLDGERTWLPGHSPIPAPSAPRPTTALTSDEGPTT